MDFNLLIISAHFILINTLTDHMNIQEAARRTVAVTPPPSSPNNNISTDMEKKLSQLEEKCEGQKLHLKF